MMRVGENELGIPFTGHCPVPSPCPCYLPYLHPDPNMAWEPVMRAVMEFWSLTQFGLCPSQTQCPVTCVWTYVHFISFIHLICIYLASPGTGLNTRLWELRGKQDRGSTLRSLVWWG